MELNKHQQDMLDGKYGEGPQLAMKVQVAIGESFNAKRMVPITRAHIALCNQDADRWFAEKMAGMGAKFRVPATVNPGFSLCYFKGDNRVSSEDYEKMQRTNDAYKALGAVLSYNCTPYIDTNVPNFGEVIAYSESSATPYANAVWGARSNREGANSALLAAITGYVPEYGLLFDENRYGDILVEVKATMDNDYKYHMLGMCGKKIGHGIPVFVGLPEHIGPEGLRNLGAQLNTSGSYDMYHIVGFTPEAPTLEAAFGGKEPKRKVTITDDDFEEILEDISLEGNREIDFVMFGCPHFTLKEIIHIANMVRDKKLKKEIYILASSHVKRMAIRMGLNDVLEEAGAHIVQDSCPDQDCWKFLEGKIGLTESPKCAYYPQRRGINFVIRDLDTCVNAAITGEVK
ncbi:aconitase X catalytic domain-containing protein [Anaerosphaera multitolerans]|uniref:DUF521 domain-containing protein n=1 Tax=Anaerosphaera multitolerans TaxID=2487351 RepID=A0A437S6R4_9FIRM|nr:aconitase X catalytic domain-containing protein [Anaerosphaera multitolerans]RVU54715.1 DUF521 domain-containing protein [Anaerosphaera multitolerans]